jgi:glycosyltransferase involved in cell wall biosynthesis
VAKALLDLGCLQKFYTSSYVSNKWLQILIERIQNKFWSRRFLTGLAGDKVEADWLYELPEIFYRKIGKKELAIQAVYNRDKKFDRHIAQKLPRHEGDIFWGFQGSCLESLSVAKASGKTTICELSSVYPPFINNIIEEEKQLSPEWAKTMTFTHFPKDYFDRLCEEPLIADVIIGASRFTLDTLRAAGIEEKKLKYLPLGAELSHIPFTERKNKGKTPLKVLFVGRVSQLKGIKYLMEAVNEFDPKEVELHLIGHVVDGSILRTYKNHILHDPLQQYELFAAYREFDLLVLPTLFDGFGLVVIEAMAAGLPVIATTNSTGPEIVREGMNGYIVPIRSSEAIAEAIRTFLLLKEEERQQMRLAARASALDFSWARYQERLANFLENEF